MPSRNPSPAQTEARRKNSRKSTGPRTCRGKRHSSRNALKHGLYSDVQYFCGEAAIELGEDPSHFRRLYLGLLAARPPADALEQVLVEDIAVLIYKKARLERSEAAVQVCNVRKHDLERRKQYLQVGRDGTTMTQAEMLEKGLRVTLDSPGKFEKVLEMLGMLEDLLERNEFSDTMHRLLLALYGQTPTLRGAGLLNGFMKLRKLSSEGQDFGDAKEVFNLALTEELEEVLGEYDLFLHEHVENTRAARIAAMAPSHAQWAAIIRQQNALHRQMERKIRLLEEMQEGRRRRLGSAADWLAKLMPPGFRGGGGGPAPTPEVGAVREPPQPQPTGRLEPTGVAPASRGSSSGCMGLSPQSEQERVADMPEGGTSAPPTESAIAPRPLGGEGSGGKGGPVPAQGNRSTGGLPPQPAEKTQNSGNEAKNSLKTKCWVKIECARRTPFCTPEAPNEAPKAEFRCALGVAKGEIEM